MDEDDQDSISDFQEYYTFPIQIKNDNEEDTVATFTIDGPTRKRVHQNPKYLGQSAQKSKFSTRISKLEPNPLPIALLENAMSSNENDIEERWTTQNVRLLVTERLAMENQFKNGDKSRATLWRSIVSSINKVNNNDSVTIEQAQRKFNNLKTTYTRNKKKQRKTGRDAITWEYFDLFDEEYGFKYNMDNPTNDSLISTFELYPEEMSQGAPTTCASPIPTSTFRPNSASTNVSDSESDFSAPAKRKRIRFSHQRWVREYLEGDKATEEARWKESVSIETARIKVEERKAAAAEKLGVCIEKLLEELAKAKE